MNTPADYDRMRAVFEAAAAAAMAFRPETVGEAKYSGQVAGFAHVAARVCDEAARLRAGLELLAQVRAVCGSAQGAFRVNLRVVDAVLLGADVRDPGAVEAVMAGRWAPPGKG